MEPSVELQQRQQQQQQQQQQQRAKHLPVVLVTLDTDNERPGARYGFRDAMMKLASALHAALKSLSMRGDGVFAFAACQREERADEPLSAVGTTVPPPPDRTSYISMLALALPCTALAEAEALLNKSEAEGRLTSEVQRWCLSIVAVPARRCEVRVVPWNEFHDNMALGVMSLCGVIDDDARMYPLRTETGFQYDDVSAVDTIISHVLSYQPAAAVPNCRRRHEQIALAATAAAAAAAAAATTTDGGGDDDDDDNDEEDCSSTSATSSPLSPARKRPRLQPQTEAAQTGATLSQFSSRSVWPACGYLEFPYLLPGRVVDRRSGKVISRRPDDKIASRCALYRDDFLRKLGARFHSTSGMYVFALYEHKDALVRRVFSCPSAQRHFAITIEDAKPVYFYALLEFKLQQPECTFPERAATLLAATVQAFEAVFESLYGATVRQRWRDTLCCYSATVPDKYSFRLHSSGVAFESVLEHRRFMLRVRSALDAARTDEHSDLHEVALKISRDLIGNQRAARSTSLKVSLQTGCEWVIDFGVYHPYRSMRLAFNSKPEKQNTLRKVTWSCDQRRQMTEHPVPTEYEAFRRDLEPTLIVVGALESETLPLLPAEPPVAEARRLPAHAFGDPAVPDPPPSEVLDALLKLVRQPSSTVSTCSCWLGYSDPFFVATSTEDPRLLLFNYHSHQQECPFGGVHSRLGFWLKVDIRTRAVTMGCLDRACSTPGNHIMLGTLPVCVPSLARIVSDSHNSSSDSESLEQSDTDAAEATSGPSLSRRSASPAAEHFLTNRFVALFEFPPSRIFWRRDPRAAFLQAVLTVERNQGGQCLLRAFDHGSQRFEDRLVVSPDGYAQWECSAAACRDQSDTERVRFARAPKDLSLIFSASTVLSPHDERGRDHPEEQDPTLLALLGAFNTRFAVTRFQGGSVKVVDLLYRNHDTGDTYPLQMTRDAFVLCYGNIEHRPVAAAAPAAAARGTRTEQAPKSICVADRWLKWPGRRTYEAVAFDPSEQCGPSVLNLWQGFTVQPRAGDCAIELEIRKRLVCCGDQEAFDYFLNFEAAVVQKPGEPLGVASCFLGPQGVGKSVIAGQMGSFFGSAYKRIAHQCQLTNHFNGWQAGTCMAFIDEAYWPGDKAAEGVLKSLISETTQMAEPKGKEAFKTRNRIKVYFASNERYVIPAALDDRRWAVFRFSAERARDVEYFASVQQHWDDQGGKEAYLHFLLNRDISRFDPMRRPASCMANLWTQKLEHMRDHEIWWYELLRAGQFSTDTTVGFLLSPKQQAAAAPTTTSSNRWPDRVSLLVLYQMYSDFYSRRHGSKRWSMLPNAQNLWETLRSTLLPRGFNYTRVRRQAGQRDIVSMYRLPPLEQCRQHFASVSQTPCAVLFPAQEEEDDDATDGVGNGEAC